MKVFDVITIFPEAIEFYSRLSLLGKAQKKKILKINAVNLRDFSLDKKHKKIDDPPYGGGPGMVLRCEPFSRAVKKLISKNKSKKKRVILFSTRGKKFDQKTAVRLSKYDHIIFLSGRYEGVDERVSKNISDEEICIGDFILSGGELPALVLIEAISRHIPGVLGKEESLEEKKGSYPVFTRPDSALIYFKKSKKEKFVKVPEILLSGDHKKISNWRAKFYKTKKM